MTPELLAALEKAAKALETSLPTTQTPEALQTHWEAWQAIRDILDANE